MNFPLLTLARAAAVAVLAAHAALAVAQTTVVSTQMRPIEEAEKMRNVILKGAPDTVNFVPEDPNTYLTRMKAELGAAQGKVHATIALDGELGPVGGDAEQGAADPPQPIDAKAHCHSSISTR